MSRRCSVHNIEEPCWYCDKGIPRFTNIEARIAVLEDRVRELEIGDRNILRLDKRKTNLVIRMGGVGDLTILTSSLQALKEKEPHRPLVLATRGENIPLLEGLPFIDGMIPIGNWGDAVFKHRYDLRYAVEPPGIGPGKCTWEDYMTVDRSDLFDRLLRVKSQKNFVLPVDESHKEDLVNKFGSVAKPFIGIVATSKSSVRVIPPEYIEPLAYKMVKTFGGTVFLLGKSEGWGRHLASLRGRRIVNLIDQLYLPEAVAMTSLLDFMVTPDTAPVHFAAALKVRTIGLFGNIHPKTRTTYYPMVTPMYPEGEMPCIPCWDKPKCDHKGKIGAECMKLMTPDRVVKEATRVWS